MREAGVQLVPMDMGIVVDLADKELPDLLFSAFETPRELARCTDACVLFQPISSALACSVGMHWQMTW